MTVGQACDIHSTPKESIVYTFRFAKYLEGSGPEMDLGGAQYWISRDPFF